MLSIKFFVLLACALGVAINAQFVVDNHWPGGISWTQNERAKNGFGEAPPKPWVTTSTIYATELFTVAPGTAVSTDCEVVSTVTQTVTAQMTTTASAVNGTSAMVGNGTSTMDNNSSSVPSPTPGPLVTVYNTHTVVVTLANAGQSSTSFNVSETVSANTAGFDISTTYQTVATSLMTSSSVDSSDSQSLLPVSATTTTEAANVTSSSDIPATTTIRSTGTVVNTITTVLTATVYGNHSETTPVTVSNVTWIATLNTTVYNRTGLVPVTTANATWMTSTLVPSVTPTSVFIGVAAKGSRISVLLLGSVAVLFWVAL